MRVVLTLGSFLSLINLYFLSWLTGFLVTIALFSPSCEVFILILLRSLGCIWLLLLFGPPSSNVIRMCKIVVNGPFIRILLFISGSIIGLVIVLLIRCKFLVLIIRCLGLQFRMFTMMILGTFLIRLEVPTPLLQRILKASFFLLLWKITIFTVSFQRGF